LALLFAGYFYFNAIKQKNVALEKSAIALYEKHKALSALKELLETQKARLDLEVNSLSSRVKTIMDAHGDPEELVKELDSILSKSRDALNKRNLELEKEMENEIKNNK